MKISKIIKIQKEKEITVINEFDLRKLCYNLKKQSSGDSRKGA